MTWYLARVELLGLTGEQRETYDKLHNAMEQKGFLRTVKGKEKTFKLPTGTYDRDTTSDLDTVLADAKAAANTVWKNPAIVVVQYGRAENFKMSGLELA